MKRFLWLGLALCSMVIGAGCGDVYRPVIIPNPPAFPDPRAAHTVVAINDNNTANGASNPGSAMVVDVSGDTDVSVAPMGLAPVHAVQQSATQVLVVNHSVSGATGSKANSLIKVNFSGVVIAITSTISLPEDSAPNFVATTEPSMAYVSLPNYIPDPVNHPNDVVPSVGVVNTSSNAVVAYIPVGNNPVAMAETRDQKKLYVANQGDGTISAFNTLDRSPRNNPPIGLGSAPLWVLARSDSQRAYVLEEDGTVATLDTTSTAGPDSVIDTSISAPGATFMLYDGQLNRLYIPSNDPQTGAPALAVLDVSGSTPQVLARVPLPAPGVAVAALPDGSRAYAASNGPPQTTAINTISSVSGDGTTATYTYDPASVTGPLPQQGMSLTISGGNDGFDGTFIVTAATGSTFQAANTIKTDNPINTPRTATGTNFLPQVTVINTSGNAVKTTITMPAVPAAGPYEAPICTSTRFRFMMAAGGDSSRVYLSSCDAGNVNIIRTSDDTYLLSLYGPPSARSPISPSNQPPPQNPVFLFAGP